MTDPTRDSSARNKPTPDTPAKSDTGNPTPDAPTPDARSKANAPTPDAPTTADTGKPTDRGLKPDAVTRTDADAPSADAGTKADAGKATGGGLAPDAGTKADAGKVSGKRADAGKGGGGSKGNGGEVGGRRADAAKGGGGSKGNGDKIGGPKERRRSLVTTLLSIFAVLLVLVGFGFFSGLGPLGRLSQRRDLNAPETLGGLSRITDQQIRERLELDRAADALSQNNEGETSVEAYGDVTSDTGLFVVIALRGKIDVNRVVADSGATPDQVQKRGTATCTTQTDDIITCYRTSNTLTVMVRNSTGKAGVDKVAPITDEAFKALN